MSSESPQENTRIKETLRQFLDDAKQAGILDVPPRFVDVIPLEEWDQAIAIWEGPFDHSTLAHILLQLQLSVGDPAMDPQEAKKFTLSLWLTKQLAELERTAAHAAN